MSFEPKRFNEIFEDMRNRTSVITDFEVGSVARNMYESFAYEVALLYEKMGLVYLSAYVDTSEGQQLDMVVSILGIERGLPDFAIGVVTFKRDVGNEDITVPLGTLVATEDTPESPKKVFQTFEPKVLPKGHTSVDIKIRAVNRGEDQIAPPETIVVMPRPIPGIKSVVNHEEIRFMGKRRETDEELRERAKNALISSGKASVVSIENALLSLPGVKDVRVKENFHFARGMVVFDRISGTGEVTIPQDTQLTATIDDKKKPFKTTERLVLQDKENSIGVNIQSLLEGKSGEVAGINTGVTWHLDSPGLDMLAVRNDKPILLGDFGIIEVFVDGPDLAEPSEMDRLLEEIDRTRAAGIFVLLKSAGQVKVDGVFRVEIDPALDLSEEEKVEYEKMVKTQIENLLKELKTGQSLLFSKLIKVVLSLEGIENLEDFKIITIKEQNGISRENTYLFSDKRIDIEEFERIHSRYICVASEVKSLTVNIRFKADGLDGTKLEGIVNALSYYFSDLGKGMNVIKSEVESRIKGVAGITLDATTLKLIPESWCERPLFIGEDVAVTFVEQPVLGDIFAYHSFLEITGTLKITLPPTLRDAEKQDIKDRIRSKIEDYLEDLKSEADVVFKDLVDIAAGVDQVLAVDLDWKDFRAELNGSNVPGRVTEEKIEISGFEKAQLHHFLINS